jgi:hypothetical protein
MDPPKTRMELKRSGKSGKRDDPYTTRHVRLAEEAKRNAESKRGKDKGKAK